MVAELQASMGPRSLNRGNDGCDHFIFYLSIRFNGAAVSQPRKPITFFILLRTWMRFQWGRGLSTAETVDPRAFGINRGGLQWGRGLSTAETCGCRCDRLARYRLQWGRGLS